jgi:hypothetical protein
MATIPKKRSKWAGAGQKEGHEAGEPNLPITQGRRSLGTAMKVQIDRAEIPANPRLLERHTRGELSGPLLGNSQSKKARL